jgi:hypothetical protein
MAYFLLKQAIPAATSSMKTSQPMLPAHSLQKSPPRIEEELQHTFDLPKNTAGQAKQKRKEKRTKPKLLERPFMNCRVVGKLDVWTPQLTK